MSDLNQIQKSNKTRLYFVLGTAFFLLVVWYAATTSNEFLLALPLAAIVVAVALQSPKYFWYLTIFFVPIAPNLSDVAGGIGITFPTDIFALILFGILLFKLVSEPRQFFRDKMHPIIGILLLLWLWILATSITSVRPMVSLKWLAQYTWMLGAFFFVPLLLFREERSMYRFFQLISIAFILVLNVIFFFYISTGRNPFGLRFNPSPFFVDHTVFGAFSATWVPIAVILAFKMKLTAREKTLARIALVYFLMGLFFSYSRGAWASCLVSLGLMGMFLAGKYVRKLVLPVLVIGLTVGGYLIYSGSAAKNAQKGAVSRKDLSSHIASVTNFKTDYSNAERINRWNSALLMWEERPVMGFGPGTYAMEYGNFQKARYLTPVSTKQGDNGTAHNEFLLALSEMGLLGMLIMGAFFVIPLFHGIRGYHRTENHNRKMLYLGVTFAMVAYDIHAFVNNFMDQDKIGVTFYGFMAILVCLDRAYIRERKALSARRGNS